MELESSSLLEKIERVLGSFAGHGASLGLGREMYVPADLRGGGWEMKDISPPNPPVAMK